MNNSIEYIIHAVAGKIGHRFNEVIHEEIRFHAKAFALQYRKETLQKAQHKANANLFQVIGVPLIYTKEIKLTTSDLCTEELTMNECYMLRSKDKMPKPIMYGQNIPFYSVYTYDGKAFRYTQSEEGYYLKHTRFGSPQPVYDYYNDYLYINNDVIRKKVLVKAPFEDPQSAAVSFTECFNCKESDNLGIEDTQVNLIIQSIIQLYGYTEKDTEQEVNI